MAGSECVRKTAKVLARYKIKRYARSVGQRRRSSGRISRWRCGEFLVQFSPSATGETSGFRLKCAFSFFSKVNIGFHYYFRKFHVIMHLFCCVSFRLIQIQSFNFEFTFDWVGLFALKGRFPVVDVSILNFFSVIMIEQLLFAKLNNFNI